MLYIAAEQSEMKLEGSRRSVGLYIPISRVALCGVCSLVLKQCELQAPRCSSLILGQNCLYRTQGCAKSVIEREEL